MARASRSSKKQPAFDPSELEDLIFSPAVGQGVGSHLIRAAVVSPNVATVIELPEAVPSNLTTVAPENLVSLTTVDTSDAASSEVDMATVAMSAQTVATFQDQAAPHAPVIPSPLRSSGQSNLWITEHGDLVPPGRIRRIRLAQDAINSAEECVYNTLWNARLIQVDERESCRLVQAGYDALVKRTRLSRKTIQRIIAKLIEKDFIAVETRADIYQRVSTVYRVFSYRAVLERNVQKGRLHVAKIGPGFAFARPIESSPTLDLSTVDTSDPSVDPMHSKTALQKRDLDMTTVVNSTTVTVVNGNPTTVVKMSPYLLDAIKIDNTSSAPAVRAALSNYGSADDDAVRQLLKSCREQASDCTEEEIIAFIEEKGSLMKHRKTKVGNPIGFLLAAVPKCFSPDNFQKLRQERALQTEHRLRQESEEQASAERWRREQEALLSDPAVSEQEKHLIRLCLGLNES